MMATWQCVQLSMYLLAGTLFIWSPGSCLLSDSVSSQAVGPPNSPKKYLMQSYYNRYTNLHDSDFEKFMYQEVTSGFCEVLPDNHNVELRLSVLKRNLIGEGSHRSVSTLIKFRTKQLKSLSKLLSYSCELIIIERLPSGIFADPFELQRLVQRGGKSYSPAFQFQRKNKMGKKSIFLISGISPYFLKSITLLIAVFSDVAVFGDTNLELPSFLSNCSAVEIHLDVDPNILLEPIDVNIELPLHARYQPLNESGYSTVEFGAPDMLVRCSTKEKVENSNCIFRLKNDDANPYDAGIVWRIPSGRKAHADLVSAVTFSAALLSTLVIVVTSLCYSNSRLGKDLKQS